MNTHRERLIETRTARKILNGRRIGFLDTIDILAKPLRLLGLPVPEYGISSYKLRDNTYGFLALRNNSQSGPFEVYTGMGSDEQFMKYATYLDKRLHSNSKSKFNFIIIIISKSILGFHFFNYF